MSESDLHVRAKGRLGTVLCGKYRLESILGVGGMAVVFAATHRNQKRVAIKMLHPELSIHEELRTRFLREGYAANTVDHPGAVAVLDDDTAEDGAAFLVMERLEGDEVDRLWEQHGHRIDAGAALSLASQLLDVLAAAHAKSIIHRDIKPSNLFVGRDGTLKVLDFGIARVRDAAGAGASATSTGMMLGTPAYMAPEQALGKSKEIDATTDLWSVGATLFSLLSGRFVHEGETATQLVVLAATTPARSLATVAPDIDPRVVALVDRALAFERANRWPSALAMRDAVRAAHIAVFGSKLGKEPLARLLGGDPEAENAPTAQAIPVPPPDILGPIGQAGPPPAPKYTMPAQTMDEPAPPPRTREMTGRPSWPPSPGVAATTPAPRFVPQTQDMVTPGDARSFAGPPTRLSQTPTPDWQPPNRPSAAQGYAPAAYTPPPGYAPGGLVLQQGGSTPAPMAAGGVTTAHPVSSESYEAGLRKKGSLLLPAAVFGGALVVAIGLWLGLSQHGSSAPPAPATEPPSTSAVAPVAPQIPAVPVVPALPAVPAAPRAPSPPPPSGVVLRPVTTVPTVSPLPPQPTPAAPTPRAPTRKPNCDPPYTFDKDGIQIAKPECT